MRALPKPCLKCGALSEGSYCKTHGQTNRTPPNPAYQTPQYKTTRKQLLAQHQLHQGNTCPGYGIPPHPVIPPNILTIDHHTPLSAGGTNHPTNLTILCQACNTRKGGTNRTRGGRGTNAANNYR